MSASTVDYILFSVSDVEPIPDPEEVSETRYMSPQELRTMLNDGETGFTPWFRLAAANMLFQSWGDWEEALANGWSESRIESNPLQKDILRM